MKTTKNAFGIIMLAMIMLVNIKIMAQVNPSPSGYIPSSQEYWDAIPLLTLSPQSASVILPVEVDNSTQIFSRKRIILPNCISTISHQLLPARTFLQHGTLLLMKSTDLEI